MNLKISNYSKSQFKIINHQDLQISLLQESSSSVINTMQKQQFGIMDEGYFVPKSQILAWINGLLQINITKIQALGSGSIYCQIFDVIHPGKIVMSKINWKAKNDTEFLANFRLLQTAMEKIGIKRYVEVEKLVKAKYQDNLQFIQWFKRYFDTNCGNRGEGYDAVEKRNKVVPDFGFCQKTVIPKVYNATGQIAHREKVTSPHAKKQQLPPRLKSPRAIKTPVVNNRKTPVVHEKKEEPKKVQVKKPQPVKKPPVVAKRPVTSHHVEVPKPESHKKIESSSDALNKKIKDLTQKLEMIKEIVISEDVSDMKVDMIRELLNVASQKQTAQQSVQVQEKNEPLIVQSKQQEQQSVTETVSQNDDLLTHEQPQSEQGQHEEPTVSQTPVESHEAQFSETNQQESLLEEKPDLSQVTPSEHDDDII